MIRHRWRSHIKNADSEQGLLELVHAYLAKWRMAQITHGAEADSHKKPERES